MNNGEKLRDAILAACWAAFAWAVAVYSIHPIHDGDTWWHLAQGREMVARHLFLRSDIFSYTLNGTPWINFEWASEIGAYLIVHTFGLKGLILVKAALGLLALGLLIRLIAGDGMRGPWLFALTWLAYHVLQVRLCTRVELISFIFFPALLLLIERARAHAPSKNLPMLTGAMFIVWANTHAGFAYGLLLMGCYLIGARWAHDPSDRVATLDRMFVAGLVGSLINPWGPQLFTVFLQHAMDFNRGANVLAEWETPTLASAPAFWTCYALGAAAIIWTLLKKRRRDYAWVPAAVVFAVVSSRYLRTTSYLAFIALPFAARRLKDVRMKPAIQIGFTLAACGLLWFERPFFYAPRHLYTVDSTTVPNGGVAFLNTQHIDGQLFNTYAFGGFVEWTNGGARPVFMDGRYIFYPLVEEYEDVMLGKKQDITAEHWSQYFDHYGVDYALVKYEPLRLHRAWDLPIKHESAMNVMFPKKTWALVYWDDACLVFLKRVPKFDGVIAANEYKTVMPYDLPAAVNAVAINSSAREQIEQDLKRNQYEVGPTWRADQIRAILNQKS